MTAHFSQRTDNEIKNHWNTHVKKRLTKMGINPVTHKPNSDALGLGQMKDSAKLRHMAQRESARLEAEARLVRESKLQVSSNPSQPVLGSSSTSAQLLNKPASASASAPPPFTPLPSPLCLDVLTAWQGAWLRAPKDNSISGNIFAAVGNVESPTSASNFGKIPFPIPNSTGLFPNEYVNVNEADVDYGWCEAMAAMTVEAHELGKPNHFSELKEIMDNAMQFQEMACSGSGDDLYKVTAKKTTNANMLLPNFMEGLTDLLFENSHDMYQPTAGRNSCNVSGTCCGDFEENKNYWNTIMNPVNCSPQGRTQDFYFGANVRLCSKREVV
ncbi:hypothetical protein U1Q18_029286 [Sarracenia purpurea var. burkii]